MTLDDWRLLEGLTFEALAEKLSHRTRTYTAEAVRRWCMAEDATLARFPDRTTLRRIYNVTGGQVTPNDFVGIQDR